MEPEPDTRDPFDRMLLAQCEIEGLRLSTTDPALVHIRRSPKPLAAIRQQPTIGYGIKGAACAASCHLLS